MHDFANEIAEPKHDVILLFDCDLAVFGLWVSQCMPHGSVFFHLISFCGTEIYILFVHQCYLLIRMDLSIHYLILSLWIKSIDRWCR